MLLNLKLSIFVAILQVLKFEFQMFRILEILNFHPCLYNHAICHKPNQNSMKIKKITDVCIAEN